MAESASTEWTKGSTEEWRHLAQEEDVLYNILAWDGMRGSWTEEQFYAAGASDWADFRHHWSHYRPKLGGTCVEIGCGAGRMSRALAGDFDRVVALDVSPDMIAKARAATPDNVECRQVEGPSMPLGDGEADAVFSVHVLQHLDRFEAVRSYLAEARRVLRPGGTIMVHIPLQSRPPSRLQRALIELGIWRSRRGLRRGRTHTLVRMRIYQEEMINNLLRELGFDEVELRVFGVRWNGHRHHFWFATAPG